MTIASTTSKVSYNGSGSVGPFPVTFKFIKNADIVATKRSSLGVETVLSLTTHYTLAGAGEASGGALTLVTALAVGESLVIARVPGIVQEVDYVENSAFPAETHEGALDLLTTICQSLQEQVDRSVKVEISSTTSPDDLLAEIAVDVAGAAAAVDAAETAQGLAEDARDAAIAAAASVPTFGAFGLTLAATTTASNARASLVLGTAAEADTGTGAGDVPVLDAGGKLDASVFPSTAGTDATARDLAVFNSLLNQIDLGRASGAIPSGYMHLFLTDELATKTNSTYDATGDFYANSGPLSDTKETLTAGMFSATGVTSFTAASLVDGITAQSSGGYIASGQAAGAGYKIDLGAGNAKALGRAKIYSYNAVTPGMKVQYSDDGINYSDAGGSIASIGSGAWGDITWDNSGAHRYWWLRSTVIAAANSGWLSEVEVYAFPATTNMTLIPAAITAGSAPETVDIYLLHNAVDSVTLNTDLKARVSRDNGSTWSGYATLTEVCQYDADYKLLKGTADLSALASGTSVKWEITTLNTKSQRVRAAAMILNS